MRYPVPTNLNIWWAGGSVLLFCLIRQIGRGLILSFHYQAHETTAFRSIQYITNDVAWGWFFRGIHINTCVFFFFVMYLHIGRGIFYGSYLKHKVWYTGVVIMFLLVVVAFLGYTLPWGQLSFWAAVVVTNILTGIPYVGKRITIWLLGGYVVNCKTLQRFYILHLFLPFVLLLFTLLHVYFLHEVGSGDPLGLDRSISRVGFHPYYTYKDIFVLWHFVAVLYYFVFFEPYYFLEASNYVRANYYKTPNVVHPEIYLIFAYRILCACNTKNGGLLAMLLSILILVVLPVICPHNISVGFQWHWLLEIWFGLWCANFVYLTCLGYKEDFDRKPSQGKCCTLFHFSLFFAIRPVVKLDSVVLRVLSKKNFKI